MPADTTLAELQNPMLPVYDPLAQATTPNPPAEIITTADVNGPNGSVDNGGPIDRCVWRLNEAQAAGMTGQMVARLAPYNKWANERFGLPFALPTLAGTFRSAELTLLGGLVGGFHGYQRSGGKGLSTVGYGLAGMVAPFITLGVGLLQGYGKRR